MGCGAGAMQIGRGVQVSGARDCVQCGRCDVRCGPEKAPRGTGPVHPGTAPPPSRRAAPRAFASLPTSGAFRALFFADDDVSTEAGVAGLHGLWKATPWASKIR